jgi:hypothetical protein
MAKQYGPKKPVAELSNEELESEISSIVDQKILEEIENRKKEIRSAVKHFSLGLILLGGSVLALLASFPGYVAKVILNREDIKTEVYTFVINSLEDNKKIKAKVFDAVKSEFISGSDIEFRNAIINQDVKADISKIFVEDKLPKVKLTNLSGVKEELPGFTWKSLTEIEKKRDKINEFLEDGHFIDALKDNYYDKVLVLYESAAKVDQKEHVAILKKRGAEGDLVDIEGIGMEYDGRASNCPNSIIDQKRKQAIIVLPNAKMTLENYPDIKDIQKLQFNHLRCNSSVFPCLTLKIQLRGTLKAEDIDLVGVEIRDNYTSRHPLVRVTNAVSEELKLPSAQPKNLVSATGRLHIQDAKYP